MRRSLFKITVHTLAVILWALPLMTLHATTALQESDLPHQPSEQVMADCSGLHSASDNHLPDQSQTGESCGSGQCDLCCSVQIVMTAEIIVGIRADQSAYMSLHPDLHPEPVLFPFLRPPEHIS